MIGRVVGVLRLALLLKYIEWNENGRVPNYYLVLLGSLLGCPANFVVHYDLILIILV